MDITKANNLLPGFALHTPDIVHDALDRDLPKLKQDILDKLSHNEYENRRIGIDARYYITLAIELIGYHAQYTEWACTKLLDLMNTEWVCSKLLDLMKWKEFTKLRDNSRQMDALERILCPCLAFTNVDIDTLANIMMETSEKAPKFAWDMLIAFLPGRDPIDILKIKLHRDVHEVKWRTEREYHELTQKYLKITMNMIDCDGRLEDMIWLVEFLPNDEFEQFLPKLADAIVKNKEGIITCIKQKIGYDPTIPSKLCSTRIEKLDELLHIMPILN